MTSSFRALSLRLLLAFALLVVTLPALVPIACTPAARRTATTIVDDQGTGCTVLQAFSPSGLLQTLCAFDHELVPALDHLLAGRKAGAKVGAGQDCTEVRVGPPDNLRVVCATNEERLALIAAVAGHRQAAAAGRADADGGAPR